MNEIDKEYILNQLNDGYIDLGIHDEKEIEYLKLVVSNYENLQFKIDKAIEILGQYKHLSSPTEEQANEQEEIVSNAYDILKEDK